VRSAIPGTMFVVSTARTPKTYVAPPSVADSTVDSEIIRTRHPASSKKAGMDSRKLKHHYAKKFFAIMDNVDGCLHHDLLGQEKSYSMAMQDMRFYPPSLGYGSEYDSPSRYSFRENESPSRYSFNPRSRRLSRQSVTSSAPDLTFNGSVVNGASQRDKAGVSDMSNLGSSKSASRQVVPASPGARSARSVGSSGRGSLRGGRPRSQPQSTVGRTERTPVSKTAASPVATDATTRTPPSTSRGRLQRSSGARAPGKRADAGLSPGSRWSPTRNTRRPA